MWFRLKLVFFDLDSEFCERGGLGRLLLNKEFKMDMKMKMGIIRDIARGVSSFPNLETSDMSFLDAPSFFGRNYSQGFRYSLMHLTVSNFLSL